eukprot:3053124-Alexandrium_andersonii.AAC.1
MGSPPPSNPTLDSGPVAGSADAAGSAAATPVGAPILPPPELGARTAAGPAPMEEVEAARDEDADF